jgi:hypothetical protein
MKKSNKKIHFSHIPCVARKMKKKIADFHFSGPFMNE